MTCTQNKSAKTGIQQYPIILGSARTGLILTRSQDGTQLGGLTQTGQTKHGVRYHVPSYWVLSWGAGRGS